MFDFQIKRSKNPNLQFVSIFYFEFVNSIVINNDLISLIVFFINFIKKASYFF